MDFVFAVVVEVEVLLKVVSCHAFRARKGMFCLLQLQCALVAVVHYSFKTMALAIETRSSRKVSA